MRCWHLVLCLAASTVLLATSVMWGDDGQKGLQMEPVSNTAPHGNAALFVGVNQFTQDTGLRPLNFAVDDAISQAHVFVVELKLVPGENCYLAKSGDPSNDESKQELDDLVKAGVKVVGAGRAQILYSLGTVESLGGAAEDMVVVSISSHGFENDGIAYAMPADGLRNMLEDSALSISRVEKNLSDSKAGKRLLLIDACREKASADGKGGNTLMTAAFHDALVKAQGQAVLASCDAGQISYETPELHHGIFTYYLIEALRGKAELNSQGFITLGTVSKYVNENVKKWVGLEKRGVAEAQQPWFEGPKDAQEIPLAMDPGVHKKQAERIEALKKLFMDGKITAEQYEDGQHLINGKGGDDPASLKRAQFYSDLADGNELKAALEAADAAPPPTAPPPVAAPELASAKSPSDTSQTAGVVQSPVNSARNPAPAQPVSLASAQSPAPEQTSAPQSAAPEAIPPQPAAPALAPVTPVINFDYFHDQLAPWGTWIEVGGVMFWRPDSALAANPDWRPYYDNGQWTETDNGLYWQSSYSWGDIPFHYGRWIHDPNLGWLWAPDYTWGPAWVFWRHAETDESVGWAPLPVGADFVDGTLMFRGVAVSVDFDFGLEEDSFTFIGYGHFHERFFRLRNREYRYHITQIQRRAFYGRSVIRNDFRRDSQGRFVNEGIGRDRIARLTKVNHETFQERNPVGDRDKLAKQRAETPAGRQQEQQQRQGQRSPAPVSKVFRPPAPALRPPPPQNRQTHARK